MSILAACASAQTQESPAKWPEDLEKKFPPVRKNAAAEEFERMAVELGIRPSPRDLGADSEAKPDPDAYRQAGFSSWLDAQIKMADDTISAPPRKLEEFLEQRRPIVSRLVALLVHEVPDWDFDVRQTRGGGMSHPDLLMIVAINKVLLSAALIEERARRHAEAGDYLEASWSLSQSLVERPDFLSLIITVTLWRQQSGAVRKMGEAPFQWLERLSNEGPRRRLVSALEDEPLLAYASNPDPLWGEAMKRMSAGYRVAADLVLESSPCQLARLSRDEIRDRMLGVFKVESEPEPVSDEKEEEEPPQESNRPEPTPADIERAARVMMGIGASTAIDLVRRVERLLVDRELTLKILEVRQERAASRARRWPARLFDAESRVCKEASYEYEQRGGGMRIRFEGFVDEAGAPGLILPLSFEAKPPPPPPSPTRAPKPKQTPRPTVTKTPH